MTSPSAADARHPNNPHPDTYPRVCRLRDVDVYLKEPVRVQPYYDALDFFGQHPEARLNPGLRFFGHTHEITEHDFMLLTRRPGVH